MNEPHKITWESAVETLRSDPSQQDLVQACFYDDPLTEAAERYHASTEWRAIRALLPASQGASLDIGAGRGIAAYAFAKDGWQSSALEPDPSGIVGAEAIRTLSRDAGVSIHVVEEWGESLPFPDGHFDVVHCRAVLHHAHDLKALCAEVARVLKPGGIFLATREHVVSSHADIPAFQEGHPLHRLYGGEYAYTLAEYKDAISDARLTLTRCFNPLESDINLYPSTIGDIKAGWAKKLKLPVTGLIPDSLVGWWGSRNTTPGRLYTFVSRKAA